MKKTLLFLALALSAGTISAQKGSPWQKAGADKLTGRQAIRSGALADNQRLYTINQAQLQESLSAAAGRFSGSAGVQISVPNAKGQIEQFLVWEQSNFEPELQAQYPEIRSYIGKSLTDAGSTLTMSVSPRGVKTMILRAGQSAEFVEPYTTDRSVYVVIDSQSRAKGTLPWTCATEDVALSQDVNRSAVAARANNQSFKTMRLALSCTGEYAQYHGGAAGAMAAMNETMARVNGVMEKDLSLRLNIIANNNLVIFTNPATDPYSNAAQGVDDALWNGELQSTLTNIIGNANYDIGHLFGASGGGGNAGCIGCVCETGKGRGFTSPADEVPEGDTFDIDYVAHEIGHQLGGNHTHSFTTENNSVNVEPGSGSSIMAYAGLGGTANVQLNSDAYFTYRSILQIQNNMAGKTCPTSVPTNNTPPTVNAGPDYTIPKGTPFVLKGSATDAEGDALTYTWEQNDDANVVNNEATAFTNSFVSPTKTNGPNFRTVMPTTSPNRYMPNFPTVLGGATSNAWETVSTVARTLTFTLTARDNHIAANQYQQTNTDETVLTVNATAGPFRVTYPNVTNESWIQGTSKTITWDVAGTTGNNINTSAVNILISYDAGATFVPLVSNTSNDGTETITVPNTAAPYCRIMVEAVGNIYYALSPSFAIGYTVTTTTTCNTYASNQATAIAGSNPPTWTIQGIVNVPADQNVTISDVNVGVNITHARINDLYVGIHPPGPISVAGIRILYQQGCTTFFQGGGMNTTFDDQGTAFTCTGIQNGTTTLVPLNSLNVFNGMQSAGEWRLVVADLTLPNSGTFNGFSVNICSTTTTAVLSTDNFELTDFSLYPNPNNGSFNVKFTPNGTSDIKINVHDIQGRTIFTKKFEAAGIFEENLQLPSVQAGVYLVTVENGASKTTKRIVVE